MIDPIVGQGRRNAKQDVIKVSEVHCRFMKGSHKTHAQDRAWASASSESAS